MGFDVEAFDRIKYAVENGDRRLTLRDAMDILGADFCELLVEALMDSQDAARAIQGAINRLRSGAENDPFNEDDVEEVN